MKKKKTNKLLVASIFACFGLASVMTLSTQTKQQYESAKAVTYYDDNESITLDYNELSYSYVNFYTYIEDEYDNSTNVSLSFIYDGDEYTFSQLTNSNYYFQHETVQTIYIYLSGANYHFVYEQSGEVDDFIVDDPLDIIYNENEYNTYQQLKHVIEVDIQANQPQPANKGDTIIEAVSSGLGLTTKLAKEFLAGFTGIFWDTTNQQLTTASEFMLVFLGIAIVMACIKLALALLRNNTGA